MPRKSLSNKGLATGTFCIKTKGPREELRVAGARPRRDWSVGVEALTPSELRIVRLARDGRTNRQIAQELFVSIKTVEGHLARAYGKLGIASREELDRVLNSEKTRVSTL